MRRSINGLLICSGSGNSAWRGSSYLNRPNREHAPPLGHAQAGGAFFRGVQRYTLLQVVVVGTEGARAAAFVLPACGGGDARGVVGEVFARQASERSGVG